MFNFKYLISSCLAITSLIANDGFDDEDEFGDDEIELVQIETKRPKDFTTYGSVVASSNYSYKNKDKISSAKISTNIKFEYLADKSYKVKSTIKAYKEYKTNIKNDTDFDLNELTIEGTLNNNIDGKFGRQIVVWGKSDNIRIVDILNPLDVTTLVWLILKIYDLVAL